MSEILAKVPTLSPEEHPSTFDIIARQGPDFTLQGKTILVTGASSGIGVDTVRAFASKGAKVFVAVRDVEKTKEVLEGIAKEYPNNGGLEIVKIELDSLESVNKGADDFLSRSSQLHILVNNAGVMNVPFKLTKDGHEYQFGVNHLAHFLLFKRLLPLLLKSSTPSFQSRVVNVSSRGHHMSSVDLDDLDWSKRGYNGWTAYGQAKTANILMAREIECRYGDKGLHAFAVHPGSILTELARYTPLSDWVSLGFVTPEGEPAPGLKFKTSPQGAATTVWAAIGKDLEGKGGLFLENAKVASVSTEGFKQGGYAPHAFDEQTAKKLWDVSEKLVNA